MKDYTDLLISQYGFSKYEAELTNIDLNNMDAESVAVLEKLIDGEDVSTYACRDINVGLLVEKYKLSIIAAVLSVDMLKKDYDGFIKVLNSNK